LPATHSTAVFRIVQEALTNIAKHAHARAVVVTLERRPTEVIAHVRDDGRGYSSEEARKLGSLGLTGLRERARLIGGEANVRSAPGKGTQIEVRLPLAPDEVEP